MNRLSTQLKYSKSEIIFLHKNNNLFLLTCLKILPADVYCLYYILTLA